MVAPAAQAPGGTASHRDVGIVTPASASASGMAGPGPGASDRRVGVGTVTVTVIGPRTGPRGPGYAGERLDRDLAESEFDKSLFRQ